MGFIEHVQADSTAAYSCAQPWLSSYLRLLSSRWSADESFAPTRRRRSFANEERCRSSSACQCSVSRILAAIESSLAFPRQSLWRKVMLLFLRPDWPRRAAANRLGTRVSADTSPSGLVTTRDLLMITEQDFVSRTWHSFSEHRPVSLPLIMRVFLFFCFSPSLSLSLPPSLSSHFDAWP